MKKTLIALAAVAATGAAFAQSSVTISGKFGPSYGKSIGGQSNLGVTDGDVRFTSVEDLGGGLKATAAMELRVRGRGAADDGSATGANSGVGGRNSTLSLAGGFGSVTLGAIEAGNGIMGLGFAGAPVNLQSGYDGAILSGVANLDYFNYTTPALIPGMTLGYTRVDSAGTPALSGATAKGVAADVVGLNYANGPIAAAADYTVYNTDRTRVRISASYDLGIAKIGAGFEDNKKNGVYSAGTQNAFGVTVPMGALTLGAVYAINKEGSASLGAGKTEGWGIGADYGFSKRTVLNVSYGDRTKMGNATDSNGDQYRVRLMHTF
ncbi:porin [Limnohabitans sp.]|uniref:porin n=1 Tax=Limnohabitans sp. TaxID=1907725 RepID=UPI002AFF2D1E|nr:porin [Limnohabitans sp.]